MSNGNGPSQVLIIRHGEKLGDPSSEDNGGPDLSVRGSARATALPSLFLPASPAQSCVLSQGKTDFKGAYQAVHVNGNTPAFATPAFLFATAASTSSNRPVETVTPLAVALGLSLNDSYKNKHYSDLATEVLSQSQYSGQVVLICWHHGEIPALAQVLRVADPPPWPGSVFDRVWQITYASGAASLLDLPQSLLYGDSSS
jgi:hypothetical protein